MAAQPRGVENVKAYVFIVRTGPNEEFHHEDGCIAGNHDEALAIMEKRYADRPHKVGLFNVAFAVMRPGLVEWWDWQHKRHEAEGYYTFLMGMFFCKCGTHQVATRCGKWKSLNSDCLHASIYSGNHSVKPL